MKSFEEIRKAGITDAQARLASTASKERIAAVFSDWWGHQQQGSQGRSHREHPATEHLANALRAAGLEAAADFAADQWVKEAPIHPGTWLFATLLGESFVEPFVEALLAGGWRDPSFFGLEQFGAWDAFDVLMRDRLRAAEAGDAAMKRLRSSVEKVRADPLGSMLFHGGDRSRLAERIKLYTGSPDIDEVWEHPFDPPVCIPDSFLWDAMFEVRPTESLALLGGMPHPVFMRTGRHERLIERPEKIGELIRVAPDAFDAGGAFQAGGAVAVLLLEIATAGIERTALDSDGWILVAPPEEPELLQAAVERCHASIKAILDPLFSRNDAAPLAWVWLERLISNGKLRGRRSASGGLVVNLPALAITAIAERLSWRPDWKEWILKREKLWRIHRLSAIVSVGLFGQAPENGQPASALEWALIEADLDYTGVGDAIADGQDLTATIGGWAICKMPDPAVWFAATWQKLRPIREQNWRVGINGIERNSKAALMMLWGFAALDLLPSANRKALWTRVEMSVRDAWQTDALADPIMWPKALVRLFGAFEVDKSEGSAPVGQQMAQVLLPYIAADFGFLNLVEFLTQQSAWSIDVICEAVKIAGFNLERLVGQFLEMKEWVFALPQANRAEISRFHKLAETLSAKNDD